MLFFFFFFSKVMLTELNLQTYFFDVPVYMFYLCRDFICAADGVDLVDLT